MVVRLCCTGAKCYGYKVTLRRLKVNPRRWILLRRQPVAANSFAGHRSQSSARKSYCRRRIPQRLEVMKVSLGSR